MVNIEEVLDEKKRAIFFSHLYNLQSALLDAKALCYGERRYIEMYGFRGTAPKVNHYANIKERVNRGYKSLIETMASFTDEQITVAEKYIHGRDLINLLDIYSNNYKYILIQENANKEREHYASLRPIRPSGIFL